MTRTSILFLLFAVCLLSSIPVLAADIQPLEKIGGEGSWTIHAYVGLVLFIFYLFVILYPYFERRSKASFISLKFEVPDNLKLGIMIFLSISALYTFTYCHYICTKYSALVFEEDLNFFHLLFRFSLSLFPYFIGACVFGGFIVVYFYSRTSGFQWNSMFKSMVFASLIPICSCGAVPLAKAMLATKSVRVGAVISFLMVAPVLSPFVIIFSFQLGVIYVIARIVSIFILALVTGIIIEKFVGVVDESTYAGCYGCGKCSVSAGNPTSAFEFGDYLQRVRTSFLIGWDMMISLLRYIAMGIIIGAFIAKFINPKLVGSYISSDFLGLVISTSVSLPIFLCSGQEVLILSPLMSTSLMGSNALPVGHAVAFTIAGTGICASAVPILMATIGKKATAIMVAAFWVGSLLLGLAINFILNAALM